MSWWMEYFNFSKSYKTGKDGLHRRLGHILSITIHLPTFTRVMQFTQGNAIHQLLERLSMQLVLFSIQQWFILWPWHSLFMTRYSISSVMAGSTPASPCLLELPRACASASLYRQVSLYRHIWRCQPHISFLKSNQCRIIPIRPGCLLPVYVTTDFHQVNLYRQVTSIAESVQT